MPEMMPGKRALLEMLKAEGVEYIFGNPGTSEGPIIDMLGDYPEFKYILTLQESVAMGMGESYARATGTASFVSLHVDSGLANGIALMLGRPQHRHSHGGDVGQLRRPQHHRGQDRLGGTGPAGHQVGGGVDACRPDSRSHEEGFQRGQQPPQGAGVRRVYLQRP